MSLKLKAIILAAALTASAMSAPVTLTMNPNADPTEVPNPPCPSSCLIDGLVVTKGTVSFTFSNPGPFTLLQYNFTTRLAPETYVQDPVIQGRSSVFGIAFSVPVSNIQFGLSVNTTSPVVKMATVNLFNNSTVPFASFDFGSSLTDPLAEGQFTYTGAQGPVTNILITPTGTGFTTLVFDNLTVTAAPAVNSVPAASPLGLAIAAICLAGLTMLLLRKQSA